MTNTNLFVNNAISSKLKALSILKDFIETELDIHQSIPPSAITSQLEIVGTKIACLATALEGLLAVESGQAEVQLVALGAQYDSLMLEVEAVFKG